MATTRRKALPNTYSQSTKVLPDIQKSLVDAGASEVTFVWIQNGEHRGKAHGVTFKIAVAGRMLSYRMPVDIEATLKTLQKESNEKSAGYRRVPWDRAYQVAWATMRDMLRAQMALVRISADLEMIFLPYQLENSGERTMYEVMRDEHFYLPTEADYPKLTNPNFTIVEDTN
jgi:hypothetical protein